MSDQDHHAAARIAQLATDSARRQAHLSCLDISAIVSTIVCIPRRLEVARMQTAKIFKTGGSQAVRLPASFRFDTDEVAIRRDPATGDVILSAHLGAWTSWSELAQRIGALGPLEEADLDRRQPPHQDRDPFA